MVVISDRVIKVVFPFESANPVLQVQFWVCVDYVIWKLVTSS